MIWAIMMKYYVNIKNLTSFFIHVVPDYHLSDVRYRTVPRKPRTVRTDLIGSNWVKIERSF